MIRKRFWIKSSAAAVSFLSIAVTARCAESAGDTKKFYEKVVQIQPGNANARFDLGNVYLADKRYEEAIRHYDEAGKTGLAASRMDSYYFNRAVCYAGLGKMDDAVKSLEQCIEANPGNRDAKDLLELYKSKLSP
ncbi:MAG: tetratricopeptide repeat protein [Candidatus Omnitrophota bacterium]|nr:tetratricopeptide repeat protein [Candidatus Omnitrophota bacterium]